MLTVGGSGGSGSCEWQEDGWDVVGVVRRMIFKWIFKLKMADIARSV